MTKSIDSSTNFHKSTLPFLVIILFSGVFLRFLRYFNNCSLRKDEVFLASSLIRINFTELSTLAIDYQQRAAVRQAKPVRTYNDICLIFTWPKVCQSFKIMGLSTIIEIKI